MNLPNNYAWLTDEPGPKMILEFIKLYGIHETLGAGDNQIILDWAKEVGVADRYIHDEIPWCGLVMAIIAKRAGKEVNFDPLWALNWAKFGAKVTDGPKFGDVLVFKRQGGGHVALYIGEDEHCYHCAGGNQSDAVNIVRKAKDRLYAVRRPVYKITPPSVQRIELSSDGLVDDRER